jgi:hypothetical protein
MENDHRNWRKQDTMVWVIDNGARKGKYTSHHLDFAETIAHDCFTAQKSHPGIEQEHSIYTPL